MSMWNVNARIQRLDTRARRIIAVSDIHANMPYFRGLLEKINFSERDELIIDGDPEEAKRKITAANLQAKRTLEELRDSVEAIINDEVY